MVACSSDVEYFGMSTNRARLFAQSTSFAIIATTAALVLTPMPARAAAGLAGTLSLLPGLGQVYNGDTYEGIAWLATLIATAPLAPQIAFDLWQYNMYDAYRDAKPRIGRYTNYSVFENYIGTFNPLNIIDPIGGPLLLGYGVLPGWSQYHGSNFYAAKPIATGFIGLGEEGLFRGFLFPAFSDLFSSKLVGALVSSALFGLVHTQYGAGGRIIVGAVGMIFCWEANMNAYDLRKNMFSHAWIDFFLIPPGSKSLTGANIFSQGTGARVGMAF